MNANIIHFSVNAKFLHSYLWLCVFGFANALFICKYAYIIAFGRMHVANTLHAPLYVNAGYGLFISLLFLNLKIRMHEFALAGAHGHVCLLSVSLIKCI